MKKWLKNKLRNYLGITDEMTDVWLCISSLQKANKPDEKIGISVEADNVIEQWAPKQTGNVVVAEPKFLKLLDKK